MKKLFYGDNLEVLRKYIKDETIDLCYIDPPFNSKRNYNQIYNRIGKEDKAQAHAFVDTLEWDDAAINGLDEIIENKKNRFSIQTVLLIEGLEKVLGKDSLLAYLIHITLRVTEIHRALKPTGSFYCHCDTVASHYLKLILDSVFCSIGGEYQNEITWKRYAPHSLSFSRYDSIADIIFFYTKNTEAGYFKSPTERLSKEELNDRFPHIETETGRKYQHASLEKNSNQSSRGEERIIQGKKVTTTLGWVWSQKTFDERLKINPYLIHWTGTGRPRYKIYADEYAGKPIANIWTDIPYLSASDKERLGYPTQKPEALLERIIKVSSKEGDVILDAYCGCGTTIAVAERLNRNWIGIDITYQSISLILKRLQESFDKKFEDVELHGVPKDYESAIALANKEKDKVRKEFEKWAILFYSNNRAMINEKKGGDKGIDGIGLIPDKIGNDIEKMKIIFSVKSDLHPKPAYVRELKGRLTDNDVVMGVLICLYPPTKEMIKEAKETGIYKNKWNEMEFPKLKIVYVKDFFDKNERFNAPLFTTLKEAKVKEVNKNQMTLGEDFEKLSGQNILEL